MFPTRATLYAMLEYQKMLFLAIRLYSKLVTLQISKQIRTQIHSSFVFLTVVHVRRRYGVPRGASRGYYQMCQYKPAKSFQYPWEALGHQSPNYIQLRKLQVRYKKKEIMVKKMWNNFVGLQFWQLLFRLKFRRRASESYLIKFKLSDKRNSPMP